jgi:transposase-like protein
MIRRKGRMIKCPNPNCKSTNIVVIKIRLANVGTKCIDCGERFLTGHPIIKGKKDIWSYSEDTAVWS